METLNVRATPKFFKRKMPIEANFELGAQKSISSSVPTAYIFLRDVDDSDYPSRIRIALNKAQCARFAEILSEIAGRL